MLTHNAAARRLKESGFDSVPYGEFVDGAHPEKGWINEAIEALEKAEKGVDLKTGEASS